MTKQEELERRVAMLRFTIIGGRVNGELSANETEELQKELSKLDEELSQLKPRVSYSK
jgi:hypothetical protein